MKRSSVPYQEGDWFAVPLRNGDFGVGIVARANTKGVLLGYFFGPRWSVIPNFEELDYKKPSEAVLVTMLGDLYLLDKKWPILGRDNDWNRNDWPVPVFGRVDEEDGRAWKVIYSDDDPNIVLEERPCSVVEGRNLPHDGLNGAGALEIVLSRVLEE